MTIVQEHGNKVIATFMEFPTKELAGMVAPVVCKYHESWNWLMPVVNKCTQVGFRDQPEENEFTEKWDELLCDNIGMFVGAHIEEVWRAVVTFIEWYNTKTQ